MLFYGTAVPVPVRAGGLSALPWRRDGAAALRALVLLAASVVFYAWSKPVFVFVVFSSAAIDLFAARRIESGRARGFWLALGVCANLGMLIYYKYSGFLVANFDELLKLFYIGPFAVPQIALPVGVSFVVFEKITYIVDVCRRVTKPAKTVWLYLLYVFFFPKLLAGPIIKYHDIVGQFEACRQGRSDDFLAGFSRFMLGVVKRCCSPTPSPAAPISSSRNTRPSLALATPGAA